MYTITAYRALVKCGPGETNPRARYLLEPPAWNDDGEELELEPIAVAVKDGIEISRKRGGPKYLHRKACAYGVSLRVALERGWCRILSGDGAPDPSSP